MTVYIYDILCIPYMSHPILPEFGPGVYAILKGKMVEFMMISESVTLGWNPTAELVDFNLSLEAPAFKISRSKKTSMSLSLTARGRDPFIWVERL